MEFPLDFLHYLYNYYMVCALFSHTYHVTSCDMILWLPIIWLWHLWHDTFLHSFLCSKFKRKKKKRNINNDLAILPSHNKSGISSWKCWPLSASKVQWPELSQLSLCSEFDKENSMEFLLNSLLLIHFTTVAMRLLSHGPHVTLVMWHTMTVTCDMTICDHLSQCHVIFSRAPFSCFAKSWQPWGIH